MNHVSITLSSQTREWSDSRDTAPTAPMPRIAAGCRCWTQERCHWDGMPATQHWSLPVIAMFHCHLPAVNIMTSTYLT